MRIGLGTVQFGMDYGISNRGGRSSPAQVREILDLAADGGIRVLDTAHLYGESESVLGACMDLTVDWKVVTKTPRFERDRIDSKDVRRLEEAFRKSLRRLRVERVHGLVAHAASDLLAPGGTQLLECMTELREQGLVEKIGVSVYTGDELDRVLDRHRVDLAQIPTSVLDQRLLESGHVDALRQAGVEVHVRSVFLQGVLLMPPDELPSHFARARNVVSGFREEAARRGLTPLQAALAFALNIESADVVLVGVTKRCELLDIIAVAQTRLDTDWCGAFAIHDPEIINPFRWRL